MKHGEHASASFLQPLPRSVDPFGISASMLEVEQAWLDHPERLGEEIRRLGLGWWQLQFHAWCRFTGREESDLVPVNPYDARFREPVWSDNPYLDVIKEYYVLTTRWLQDVVHDSPGVDDKTRRRAAFWTRQMLNALAPTNFFWTNPAAVIRYVETGGQSVLHGMRNFFHDLREGSISMTDDSAFEVGRNLATTPGAVVHRNRLVEVIQYAPSTPKVRAMPVVIVSPWINKYYVLDLKPQDSLLRFLVEQGFTVFVTSWRNPGAELADTSFEDYLFEGVLETVEVAREVCGTEQVHLTGYCLGGTAVAMLASWLAAGGTRKIPVADCTFFATLVDFTHPGDIDVYVDENAVALLDEQMARDGYLDGQAMATSFRTLRSNSLIWHYFVHNYLFGEMPPPFDVLYWNMDSTRLPRAMHSWYLHELYLHNRLVEPGAIVVRDRALDLGRIRFPLYVVGAEQDHIAPWKESFRLCALASGPVRYVLATSGHILGIISPPVDPPKRRYWAGDATGADDPVRWQEETEKRPGSWWTDWIEWLAARDGARVDARRPGSAAHPPICDAPGTYVLER